MLGSLQELFDLPLETKTRNVAKKLFHGYAGQHPHIPLYESMGIDDADVQEKVDELVSSLWPQGHPTFSKTIQSYAEKLSTLDHIVRRMILESLGVEKYLEEHLNSTYYFLRITKYKGPQTPETEVGLPTHTDQNLLTILYQNQINGLEVLTKNGEWISVKPSPESFIVIAGESLYAWSNGRIHSAKHRVMMSGSETRYSAGLFTISKSGYIVKVPDELVDEGHPLLFKPFDMAEFLEFYSRENGWEAESALKSYCGI
ncbi:2-oxoglutarate-dependent dioxygenase AOP3-like [Punica granatum]|uniref:2-oxoglutarate-dependent dioxygenase AOP3-like n=2 Tax=Punica granatum TaxID=22663 RepID=A0A6P8DY28_PUNGR|nr:2-oxoglutarate-dependent dioxygenase AOP3-like [Punica granatum]PKI62054.1 hypothetical protein CRG98_017427 [Punica granatum]